MPDMKPVYVLTDNIITSLGFTTGENIHAIMADKTGIVTITDPVYSPSPVALSLVNTAILESKFAEAIEKYRKGSDHSSYTRLEKMLILSIDDALRDKPVDPRDPGTILVFASTKGNIDLLEERHKIRFNHKRLFLWELARIIQQFFQFREKPLVISNACTSGVCAVMTAQKLLQNGIYSHAVVAGGDIISEFVVSGFQSFQALSADPCKPFDLHRNGLNLGEGCGTMVLSTVCNNSTGEKIRVAGSATSNDANHISGPSRTGEELAAAIGCAMHEAAVKATDTGFISAHGTATVFNDEMESKALSLSGLAHVPVNSFKGYWGHTLGAAGIIESVASVESMRRNRLFRSAGYETNGVPVGLAVIREHTVADLRAVLKTASGFGGCNAAVIFTK